MKILSFLNLKMKKNNKKSVYIALAADSIHHGHKNLIEVGRKYGEIIIGLITDSAIAEYKEYLI